MIVEAMAGIRVLIYDLDSRSHSRFVFARRYFLIFTMLKNIEKPLVFQRFWAQRGAEKGMFLSSFSMSFSGGLREGPKKAQEGPKMAPRWPQEAPGLPLDDPNMAPRLAKDGPRAPQVGPRRFQDGPRVFERAQSMFKTALGRPEGSQRAPTLSQDDC